MAKRFAALVVVSLVVGSCAASGSPPTLAGFPTTKTILIGDQEFSVAVADTAAARARGLMGVTDLGEVDGMLFVFESDTETGFFMKDTLIPLDIAFFTAAGDVVDRLTMLPCTEEPCTTYHAAGPFRYAVEAPAGGLDFMTPASVLVVDQDG